MPDIRTVISEDASPNPEYLIKSIAEQGYRLETSIADLIDNSISAEASNIEVLVDMESEPFTLFLADDGMGMNEDALRSNMQFPSNSPENARNASDLGRFGLGMKTASFAQTRALTVLSRVKGEEHYHARTWDVDYLRENGWKIIVNTRDEVTALLAQYHKLSEQYFNRFENFQPNTIIVWRGLYKFENYLDDSNRKMALKRELTEVTNDYLALVFHRFMERKEKPLQIRINNSGVLPFNPFPNEKDLRPIEYKQRKFREDIIKMEGFVLPSRSLDEVKSGQTIWTTPYMSLMDMEGIYIYRSGRIIKFGGWNGLIKKIPRLQLARLRVEVGNGVDNLLHLNVAKSEIIIPHDLRTAFENYIEELKIESEREFYNKSIRKFSGARGKENIQLFERKASNKGTLLEMNSDFPVLKNLRAGISKQHRIQLDVLLRMIETRINQIRRTHSEKNFTGDAEADGMSTSELESCIQHLLNSGLTPEVLKKEILPNLGYDVKSFPEEIQNLIK